jgi:hypothetical protein
MQSFLKFLRNIEANLPADPDIHLLMDNFASHKTATIKSWFATLTEKQIRRGRHRSARQMGQAIMDHLELHNADPRPFNWTKSADDKLTKNQKILFANFQLETPEKKSY